MKKILPLSNKASVPTFHEFFCKYITVFAKALTKSNYCIIDDSWLVNIMVNLIKDVEKLDDQIKHIIETEYLDLAAYDFETKIEKRKRAQIVVSKMKDHYSIAVQGGLFRACKSADKVAKIFAREVRMGNKSYAAPEDICKLAGLPYNGI